MNVQEKLYNIVESLEGIRSSIEVTIHGVKCDSGKEIVKDMKWMVSIINEQAKEIEQLKQQIKDDALQVKADGAHDDYLESLDDR